MTPEATNERTIRLVILTCKIMMPFNFAAVQCRVPEVHDMEANIVKSSTPNLFATWPIVFQSAIMARKAGHAARPTSKKS